MYVIKCDFCGEEVSERPLIWQIETIGNKLTLHFHPEHGQQAWDMLDDFLIGRMKTHAVMKKGGKE